MKPQHFLRSLAHSLTVLLVLAAVSLADTREYLAQAADVPQIDSITVAGTWAAGDTASVTIGYDTLTVTMGSDTTTTAQVADVIKRAINASRIDENRVGAEKRNAAGQELGAFRDCEAVTDPASSSVVLVRSKVAGTPFYDAADVAAPFTIGVTEVTAGDGTATGASVQLPTGKKWWDNAANWTASDTPDNGDDVLFHQVTVGPCYGMPTALEARLLVYQSFVGSIGLPFTNALGYTEYRQRYVGLTDAGSGTSITHQFGLGEGPGSPLVNVMHTAQPAGGLTVDAVVYNTGLPTVPGTKALNLVIQDLDGGGTVTVNNGSVDVGTNFGGNQPTFTTLNVSGTADVRTRDNLATLTVNQSGGKIDFVEPFNPANTRTFNISGGVFTAGEIGTTSNVTLVISDTGRVVWNSTKTIFAATVSGSGVFDAERDAAGRAFTVTDCDIFRGASWLDGHGRGTYTNGIDYNRCGDEDVTVRVGTHKRRAISAVP